MQKTSGRVTNWNADKAFGFIKLNQNSNLTNKDLFFHKKHIQGGDIIPAVGDKVVFTPAKDRQGRLCANKVRFINRTAPKVKPSAADIMINIFSGLFIVALSYSLILGPLPSIVVYYYVLLSLITFVLYWFDKRAARHAHWRTQESTLHLFSLLGGWLGANFAQAKLRHKSSKASFRKKHWLMILLNVAAFGFLHGQEAKPWLLEITAASHKLEMALNKIWSLI